MRRHPALWTQWFRDLKSPTATALEAPAPRHRRLLRLRAHHATATGWTASLLVRDLMTDELSEPDELPDCAGVRRTSTQAVRQLGAPAAQRVEAQAPRIGLLLP